MKFNYKVEVDLLDFVKKGKFDLVKIGMSKEEVLADFPDPDGRIVVDKQLQMEMWWYGSFELHFRNDKLESIYTNKLENLDGGESLTTQKWIFTSASDLSLLGVLKALNDQQIDYQKQTHLGQVRLKLTESGVELLFDSQERYSTNSESLLSQNTLVLMAMGKG